MLDDAVGMAPGPRVRGFRLDVDVEETGKGSLDRGSAEEMTRRTLRYWSEATGGSVLHLSAAGGSGWSGTALGGGFSGEWLRVLPDGAAADAVTEDGRDGIRVRLPVGRQLHLRWWDPASRSRIRFAPDPPAGLADWQVDLDAAVGCRGPDTQSDPQRRLRVVFQRRWHCAGEGPREADADALEQLKALGYLQ